MRDTIYMTVREYVEDIHSRRSIGLFMPESLLDVIESYETNTSLIGKGTSDPGSRQIAGLLYTVWELNHAD